MMIAEPDSFGQELRHEKCSKESVKTAAVSTQAGKIAIGYRDTAKVIECGDFQVHCSASRHTFSNYRRRTFLLPYN